MRWKRDAGGSGRRGIHIGFCYESQKERDHWEGLDLGGDNIEKNLREIGRVDMD
jgi:hypothetical protein